MKTNAPEKIHISVVPSIFGGNKIITSGKDFPNAVEYTCSDAFIEKALKFLDEHLWEYIDAKNANCDTFVNIDGDKLKENFRKYMEGK